MVTELWELVMTKCTVTRVSIEYVSVLLHNLGGKVTSAEKICGQNDRSND